MECWVLTWTCLFGKVLFCFSLLFFPWWWSFYFREVWGWCMLGQKGRRSPWIAVGGTGGGRSTWSKDSGVLCGTDSLLSGPLQCVPPVLGGRRLWVRSSACAGAAVHLSAARGQVHFRGMSHRITPLLRPFTHCLSRGEGWVCADVSMPKSSWELWNEGRRQECCERSHFSPLSPTSRAAFTLCVVLWVCLGTPHNPALSLAVSSGQPASPSLAFQDLCLSLGSSGGHGTPGIVINGWDSVLGKSLL